MVIKVVAFEERRHAGDRRAGQSSGERRRTSRRKDERGSRHEPVALRRPLRIDAVRRIASEVVRQEHPHMQVVAAVPARGGAAYTEVVLTIRGCAEDPCRLVIGVRRDLSEASFAKAVAGALRRHVDAHMQSA